MKKPSLFQRFLCFIAAKIDVLAYTQGVRDGMQVREDAHREAREIQPSDEVRRALLLSYKTVKDEGGKVITAGHLQTAIGEALATSTQP